MRYLSGALVAGLTVIALAGCGGNDSSNTTASSSTPSAPSSSTASASSAGPSSGSDSDPSAPDSVATDIGLEAQAIGLDVENYTVNHDFTVPPNQAAFQANVKYAPDLKPGSKVGYKAVGKNNFQVCVTHYAGGQPTEWSVFDGKSGLPTSGTGAPTATFCQ